MRREALAAGSDLFLTKPFDLAVLRREIASLIKVHRQATSRGKSPAPETPANRVALRLRETG